MKECSNCKLVKPYSEFYKNPSLKGKISNKCKSCHKKTTQQWDKKNPERREFISRRSRLKQQYSLTYEQYQEMLKKQNYGCAICGYIPGPDDSVLRVDHDHKCCPGKYSCGNCVRGLLCHLCNAGLGYFRDDVASLKKAEKYLNQIFQK